MTYLSDTQHHYGPHEHVDGVGPGPSLSEEALPVFSLDLRSVLLTFQF